MIIILFYLFYYESCVSWSLFDSHILLYLARVFSFWILGLNAFWRQFWCCLLGCVRNVLPSFALKNQRQIKIFFRGFLQQSEQSNRTKQQNKATATKIMVNTTTTLKNATNLNTIHKTNCKFICNCNINKATTTPTTTPT